MSKVSDDKKNKKSMIENFYLKIPKEFKNVVENPNYGKLHNLIIPLRAVIISPSGSGKSNLILNIISKFSSGSGTFETITIITKNKNEVLYNWLATKNSRISIMEGLENTPNLDSFDIKKNHLVVFDDLILEKSLKKVEDFYIRCRKMNVSVFFLSQSYYKVSKIIRQNCNYCFILKLNSAREINLILSEYGLDITKDQLLHIYKRATAEKLNALIIDIENSDPKKRFLSGFLTYLDIPPV